MLRMFFRWCKWGFVTALFTGLMLMGAGLYLTYQTFGGPHLLAIVSWTESAPTMDDQAEPVLASVEPDLQTSEFGYGTLWRLAIWLGIGLGLPWLCSRWIVRLMDQPLVLGLLVAIGGYFLILCWVAIFGWMPYVSDSSGRWILGMGVLGFLIYLELVSRQMHSWNK
ncbi:MAG: hypothetical protein JNK57_13350 [Planctomycetaceae bacterium]|nr:hypothetical protein [Planctomycetaceae bacterium]